MITIKVKRTIDTLEEKVSPIWILNTDAKGIDTVKDYILMRLAKKHGISAIRSLTEDIYSKTLSDILSEYIKVKEMSAVNIKGQTEIMIRYTFNNLKFEKDIRVEKYFNVPTNADIIRTMDDYNLAEIISCPYLTDNAHCKSICNCCDCKLSYLHRIQERKNA